MTDLDLLARLQATVGHPGTLTERLGIEFVTASAQNVTARMPVEGNTQVVGLLHGGASAALAETVGSVAATLHAGQGRGAVGVELNATHHRAVGSGWVTAVATPLHLGSRLATYEIAVDDEDGRRVCTARLTCMLVDRP
ncbi:hotdog fold thioesterase [Georgenia sp. 311]|uniref:hotdog fold thioesterase n=1 Tax=Georgenia sp. 311 TaxID=2585134 RepID=UPI0011124FC7|nr:hotdog fold thioesterase [Georgenia sp. 311]TNC17410.1 hotdog fold thioesterase [Georgenia sp. 311]